MVALLDSEISIRKLIYMRLLTMTYRIQYCVERLKPINWWSVVPTRIYESFCELYLFYKSVSREGKEDQNLIKGSAYAALFILLIPDQFSS